MTHKIHLATAGTAMTYTVCTGVREVSTELVQARSEGTDLSPVADRDPSPALIHMEAAARQNAQARVLRNLTRRSPACDGCVCFREMTETVNRSGKPGESVFYYSHSHLRHRRMCAHPAYSEAVVDYTRGNVDFMPRFTCEESRAPETICGPGGRLFVRNSVWPDAKKLSKWATVGMTIIFEWIPVFLLVVLVVAWLLRRIA